MADGHAVHADSAVHADLFFRGYHQGRKANGRKGSTLRVDAAVIEASKCSQRASMACIMVPLIRAGFNKRLAR